MLVGSLAAAGSASSSSFSSASAFAFGVSPCSVSPSRAGAPSSVGGVGSIVCSASVNEDDSLILGRHPNEFALTMKTHAPQDWVAKISDGLAIRNANRGDSRDLIRANRYADKPYFHNVRAIRANRLKPAIRNFSPPEERGSQNTVVETESPELTLPLHLQRSVHSGTVCLSFLNSLFCPIQVTTSFQVTMCA